MGELHWLGFGVLVLAMGVSVWAGRVNKRSSLAAEHP
jgi:hypothetical protein